MGLYKATNTCYVQGVLLEGEGYVELNEEQEREEKVGRFAEQIPDKKALARDPKSKKMITIGNKNLVPVKRSEIEGREGNPVDEGLILYPPLKRHKVGESSGDGIHATTFQTNR